jgi:hypothetical protein
MEYPRKAPQQADPSKRADVGSNIKVFGERTYEHMPGGRKTFTSYNDLRSHCRKMGVDCGDL